MAIAAIGHNVYVGSFLECDQLANQFKYIMHIWHPEQGDNGLCKHLTSYKDQSQMSVTEVNSQNQLLTQLCVEYKDGDRLVLQEERVEGEYKEVKVDPNMSIAEWKANLELNKPKPPISVSMEEIIQFASQEPDQMLLVHDAFGIKRSPMIGWLCKIARGADPFLGIAEVTKGCWEGMMVCPTFYHGPCTDILQHLNMQDIGYTKY
jgi:hypothetical protein